VHRFCVTGVVDCRLYELKSFFCALATTVRQKQIFLHQAVVS